MRMMKYALTFLTFLAVAVACKKETSRENGEGPPPVDAQWEFKEAALSYGGPMDSAYILDHTGFRELFLIGSSPDVEGEIELRVAATDIEVGSYKNPYVLFQYSESGSVVMHNNPADADQFEVTITAIDSISISGTFSGKVIDGLGNTRTITGGKFSVPFTKGTVQPPLVTGQLSVWSKKLCSGGGEITIRVDNQTATISQALGSKPFCGAAGTANFTLLAGEYTVKAVCANDSATYQVSISGNACAILEVDVNNDPLPGDYFPTTIQSFWEYKDNGSSALNRIVSIGEEDQDGKTYTKFTDDDGNSRYYRKEPNIYYEYTTLDFNGAIVDPPIVEFVFLKDNAAEGDSWETAEYNLTVSGLPVTAKLRCTIVQRDHSQEIGGKQYNDLIETKTELLLFNAITGFTPASSFTTIYAKGIGVVSYEEPQTSTLWEIKTYTLTP